MGNINDVVEVLISRQTKTVSRIGFGIPLIIGSNCNFVERIRTYSSLSAVGIDFAETTFEYKMAQKIFSQDIHPAQIKIGRCGTSVKMKVNVNILTIADNTNYTVTINGTAFTIDSGVGATAESIVDALVAAITGGSEPVTCVDNGTDFDIEANAAGVDFTISISKNMSLLSVNTYSEDVSDALASIRAEDDDFYFVLMTSRTNDEIEDIAEVIETMTKIFIACTFDTDVKTTSTSDIASILKLANYDRTHLVYTEIPEDTIDAAWVSLMAPKTPGQATWKFKNLKGVQSDNLTDTEINNIEGKNCNIYDQIGGINVTREGVVVSGEFTDIIRGTDWIHVNTQADVYDALINQDKISFDNAGIDVIRNKILAVLNRAVTNGILKNDPAPTVTIPDIADISEVDKSTRFLDNIEFFGYYKGAIHKVKIEGNLSV